MLLCTWYVVPLTIWYIVLLSIFHCSTYAHINFLLFLWPCSVVPSVFVLLFPCSCFFPIVKSTSTVCANVFFLSLCYYSSVLLIPLFLLCTVCAIVSLSNFVCSSYLCCIVPLFLLSIFYCFFCPLSVVPPIYVLFFSGPCLFFPPACAYVLLFLFQILLFLLFLFYCSSALPMSLLSSYVHMFYCSVCPLSIVPPFYVLLFLLSISRCSSYLGSIILLSMFCCPAFLRSCVPLFLFWYSSVYVLFFTCFTFSLPASNSIFLLQLVTGSGWECCLRTVYCPVCFACVCSMTTNID